MKWYIKYILCSAISVLALTSCKKEDTSDIYSTITLNVHCEGLNIMTVSVDNSLKGNFFQNLNTGEKYNYPLLSGGQTQIKVLKGVYIFAFDGIATLDDGTKRHVRCYEHRSPTNSLNILDDKMSITLNLMLL